MFKTIEDALMVAWGHKNVEFGSVWHPLKVVNISPPQQEVIEQLRIKLCRCCTNSCMDVLLETGSQTANNKLLQSFLFLKSPVQLLLM